MPKCSQCPSIVATATIHGEPLCDTCIRKTLGAITAEADGQVRLVHELPTNKRRPSSGRQRETRRGQAERAALTRLKLAHLEEWQAIYNDELHRHGLKPAKGWSFDSYLRKLAGSRLRALVARSSDA